jgi:hypothetical protein
VLDGSAVSGLSSQKSHRTAASSLHFEDEFPATLEFEDESLDPTLALPAGWGHLISHNNHYPNIDLPNDMPCVQTPSQSHPII